MKQTLNSFLQTVFQFARTLPAKLSKTSKKMYRSALAMTAGVSMVTSMAAAAVGVQGGGRNAMVAFAETPGHVGREETALEKAGTMIESASNGTTKQDMEEADGEEDPEPQQEDEKAEEAVREEKKLIVQEDKTSHIKTDRRNEMTEEPETEPEGSEEKCSLSESEYNVLLRIVQAEAGNCDEAGKILVANVILNRMENDKFPDTVSGVVYQKKQFSPVSNGTINTCRVTEETIEAVDKALEGEDLSEGALYFMNRGASTGRNVKWFDNHLTFLFKHGQHEFFK